jgi:hypothetical protein
MKAGPPVPSVPQQECNRGKGKADLGSSRLRFSIREAHYRTLLEKPGFFLPDIDNPVAFEAPHGVKKSLFRLKTGVLSPHH